MTAASPSGRDAFRQPSRPRGTDRPSRGHPGGHGRHRGLGHLRQPVRRRPHVHSAPLILGAWAGGRSGGPGGRLRLRRAVGADAGGGGPVRLSPRGVPSGWWPFSAAGACSWCQRRGRGGGGGHICPVRARAQRRADERDRAGHRHHRRPGGDQLSRRPERQPGPGRPHGAQGRGARSPSSSWAGSSTRHRPRRQRLPPMASSPSVGRWSRSSSPTEDGRRPASSPRRSATRVAPCPGRWWPGWSRSSSSTWG